MSMDPQTLQQLMQYQAIFGQPQSQNPQAGPGQVQPNTGAATAATNLMQAMMKARAMQAMRQKMQQATTPNAAGLPPTYNAPNAPSGIGGMTGASDPGIANA